MKRRLSQVIIVYMLLSASFAQGQHIGPPTSEDFPFNVGIIMDGGTFFIHYKASKESAAQEFCIDGQFDSKTKGELYESALHPTYEKARIVAYKKAINLFTHFRNQLKSVRQRCIRTAEECFETLPFI